jgi:hypothetical protein
MPQCLTMLLAPLYVLIRILFIYFLHFNRVLIDSLSLCVFFSFLISFFFLLGDGESINVEKKKRKKKRCGSLYSKGLVDNPIDRKTFCMEKRDFHFQHHDCVLHLNYVYELYLTDKKRYEFQIHMELINWKEHIISYIPAWYFFLKKKKKKIVP